MTSEDISYCLSEECPLRHTCVRKIGPRDNTLPHPYANFYDKDKECEFYIYNPQDDN